LFLLVAIDLFSLATLYKVVIYVGMAIFVVATLLTVISGVNYIVKNKQVLSDND
jgi:phosphatidylglycerophosphate synthase